MSRPRSSDSPYATSFPLARTDLPSETWYPLFTAYQLVLHRMRSPTVTVVAAASACCRAQPSPATSRFANGVAVRFDVPSVRKIVSRVNAYAFPLGVEETNRTQFIPSDDRLTVTPIACGPEPGPLMRPETSTYMIAEQTKRTTATRTTMRITRSATVLSLRGGGRA